jgi:hypothetical protein
MTHVSSKRIVFINIDMPPEKVANYVESYTYNMIARLELHSSSYWVIDVDSDQFDSENIIQTAACVVIGALWPSNLDQRCKALLFSILKKMVKRGIPLLVFGTAEPILLDVLGYETEQCSGLLGFSEVKQVNQRDILAFPKIERWVWRVSDIRPVDFADSVSVIDETSHGAPLLIRHNNLVYSSSVVFGITNTEMACWVHCFPQYLKGNESAIELNQDDEYGLCWLRDFLQMWTDSKAKIVH